MQPPKPPAGHAGAVDALYAGGFRGKEIKFNAAHFVVVAQGVVRLNHQFANLLVVALGQLLGGLGRAGVFGDDVPAPPEHNVGKNAVCGVQLLDRHVAQRTDFRIGFGKMRDAGLALFCADRRTRCRKVRGAPCC